MCAGSTTLSVGSTTAVASRAVAPGLAVRAQAAEVAATPAGDVVAAEGVIGLASQSDADRKSQLKDLKRRKRLNEKRELRKKGRWPPSKLKKTQNV